VSSRSVISANAFGGARRAWPGFRGRAAPPLKARGRWRLKMGDSGRWAGAEDRADASRGELHDRVVTAVRHIEVARPVKGQARSECNRLVIPPSTGGDSLSVRFMFRREVFTQISAQAVPKPQTAFSRQVGSDRGPAEETRQLAARNPSAALAPANAPQIMANGRQTLPYPSQPQVHYADH